MCSLLWLEIISEILVNLASAWFALVFIEPGFDLIPRSEIVPVLTSRLVLGMFNLVLAKRFRAAARIK